MNSLLFSSELNKKLTEFNDQLLVIEQKHVDWFKDRINHLGKKDRLENHILIRVKEDGSTVGFGFLPESELPPYIREECNGLFKVMFQ